MKVGNFESGIDGRFIRFLNLFVCICREYGFGRSGVYYGFE